MKEVYLKVPELNEIWFRKQMLACSETMSYNARSGDGGGTIDFNESMWDSWYAKWIGNKNPKFFYAYVYDKDTKEPVGHASYRFKDKSGCAELGLNIYAPHRKSGYAKPALCALVETAFENGYDELRDVIWDDQVGAHALFEKVGFKRVAYTDGAYDYRLTSKEYKDKK
ncbi:MAG: GNAT family N-acetyltransferase [Alphaproteobacteria bacterium]|nr:GNAT family N-acetyltransferase [Alphaproteobacteria bacterium]